MNPSEAALALFAVAPHALGGLRLRARADAARDAWLAALRDAVPWGGPWCRLPAHAGDDVLDGSLDLPATLAMGRPVHTQGLLARARHGLLVVPMAERLPAPVAARLAQALDGEGPPVLLLDEGLEADEHPPAALLERCALHLALDPRQPVPVPDRPALEAARAAWAGVQVDAALLQALVEAATVLGVDSARAALQALAATRVVAALAGRDSALPEDAALAVQAVLAPRATRAPAPEAADEPAPPPPPPPDDDPSHSDADASPPPDGAPLADRLVDAARSVLPEQLLALLASGAGRRPAGASGRSGSTSPSRARGRVVGARRGDPRGGARLALVDTLRAAAPWQRVRNRSASTEAGTRVHVQRDDLRVQRREHRRASTTIFAIDASGSQAMHRLAEAKGAVELLLADCYARRDRVAVIGFRGAAASLLLAPTRSLLQARRQLAGLPGGGGTPLAAGLDAARLLAERESRAGCTPLVVLLTDGRANVGRHGEPGREQAAADALASARALAATGCAALLIDTSPQPSPAAMALAQAMKARHLPLPHAGARVVSAVVRAQRGSDGPGGRRG